MITNLFSIFDPSTIYFFNINWISIILFFIITPCFFWLTNNKISVLFKILTNYIFSEFSLLINKRPYILILPVRFFIFIIFNNVIGLLSYVFTASRHISVTLRLALPIWLRLIFWGWINNHENLLIHLIPQGTPYILMPFIVLIETIRNIIRPITLAIRLRANIVAGHLLIVLLRSTFLFAPIRSLLVLEIAQIRLSLLETAVSFIQAYVFSVLITLYAAERSN